MSHGLDNHKDGIIAVLAGAKVTNAFDLFLKGRFGEALAGWLNTSEDVRARQEFSPRIEEMRRLAAELMSETEETIHLDIRDGFGNQPLKPEDGSVTFDQPRLTFRPRRKLNYFVENGKIYGQPDCNRKWMRDSGVEWDQEWHGQACLFGTGRALICLTQVLEQGTFDRLRKCPHCDKWIFARYRHQRFCSEKCQQAHFRTSPKWKAQRCKYMRDYYRDHVRCIKTKRRTANKPGKDF